MGCWNVALFMDKRCPSQSLSPDPRSAPWLDNSTGRWSSQNRAPGYSMDGGYVNRIVRRFTTQWFERCLASQIWPFQEGKQHHFFCAMYTLQHKLQFTMPLQFCWQNPHLHWLNPLHRQMSMTANGIIVPSGQTQKVQKAHHGFVHGHRQTRRLRLHCGRNTSNKGLAPNFCWTMSHHGKTNKILNSKVIQIYIYIYIYIYTSGQITIFHGSWVEFHISRYGIKQGRGDLMKIWGRAPRRRADSSNR